MSKQIERCLALLLIVSMLGGLFAETGAAVALDSDLTASSDEASDGALTEEAAGDDAIAEQPVWDGADPFERDETNSLDDPIEPGDFYEAAYADEDMSSQQQDPAEEEASDAATEDATPEEEETPVEETVELLTQGVTRVQVQSSVTLEENEELFRMYARQQFSDAVAQANHMGISRQRKSAIARQLSEMDAAMYQILISEIGEVASGARSSTVFEIPYDQLQCIWTADDLGVETISQDGVSLTEAAAAAAADKSNAYSFENLYSALLMDCPYALYWHDITKGINADWTYSPEYDAASGEYVLQVGITFYFFVSSGYAVSDYAVDTSDGTAVRAAVDRAQKIVETYQDDSDYLKLLHYKQEICALTSYNMTAAYDSSMDYGDPWQLIWVFDGKSDTNVVCEGYAKAFQYLCDLSDFDQDICSYVVTGYLIAGTLAEANAIDQSTNRIQNAHMWNIVTMEDGLNYLVDVTNCDTGMVGADTLLFLAGAVSGSVAEKGFEFQCGSDSYTYRYDGYTLDLYAADDLAISDHAYASLIPSTEINAGSFSLSSDHFVYTGEEICPSVTVTAQDGSELVQGVDYTVSYTDNIKAGTGCVTVRGTGDYSGTISLPFAIDKAGQKITASISSNKLLYGKTAVITVDGIGAIQFMSGHTGVATVDENGVVTGTGSGTATITITAQGDENHKAATTALDVTVSYATPVLSKVENTLEGVLVTWQQVDGAASYRLFRKTETSGWQKVGDTDRASLVDRAAANGTTYTYTVRCVSPDGKTYSSNYDKTGLTITSTKVPIISKLASKSDGVEISWGSLKGAECYRVFRKTDSGSWKKLADTTNLNYIDSQALTGKSYTYTVRCVTKDGKTYTSGYDGNGKTIRFYPAPPLNKAENTENGGIRITWGKINGAEKYRVFRKDGKGSWQKIADTTALNYVDTTAQHGVAYNYTIRCLSSDGKTYISGFDNSGLTITCEIKPVLKKVENYTNGVRITWGEIANCAKYRVFRKTGTGGWTKVADTTSLFFVDTKAVSGTTYTYTVRCVTKDGKTFTSGYDKKGKSVTYIAAPAITDIGNVNTGVQVKWGAVAGAVMYRLYRKTGNGGWIRVGDTVSLNLTDQKAEDGMTYTYTVRCVSEDGSVFTSGYDPNGKKITFLAPPVITELSNVGGGVHITWEKSNGAAKYRVFRKNDAGGWSALGNSAGNTYMDYSPPRDTEVTYTLRCISSDGKIFTSGYDKNGSTIYVPLNNPPKTYSFSLAYRTSPYYNRLMEVEIGSSQRNAILDVARSQLGYTEGNKKGETGGFVRGGNNYTEYGLWYYNNIDPGDTFYSGPWCSMFVSWCANEAGISQGVIPRRALVAYMKDAFYGMGRYYTWKQSQCGGGSQIIRPGDLIIFSSQPLGRLSHIGIVSSVSYQGGSVTINTIEGNKNDHCCEMEYNLSIYSSDGHDENEDVYIRGFACPAYND